METNRQRFKGVAVVTGAAQGIGRALALALAREGASLVLADIDEAGLQALQQELGGASLALRTDVGRAQDIERLRDAALERFGRVDWLFNNAGILPNGNCWELDADQWQRALDINLGGVLHAIRAFVPAMIRQGSGHIVNTSSMGGLLVGPWLAPYTVSKHGVTVLSESLQLELDLARQPIKVSVLCPGAVATTIASGMKADPQSAAGQFAGGLKQALAEHGMSPEQLARQTLDGVAAGRFWLLPHPLEVKAGVRERAQRIVDEQPPVFNREPPMRPTMQLNPQAAAIAEGLAQLPRPDFSTLTVEHYRAGLAMFPPLPALPDAVAQVTNIHIDGPGGPLAVRLYRPQDAGAGPLPLTVFFHGGGFVACGLDSHDNICHRLAVRGRTLVASVDYRLAPEHPFPAPVDDAVAALRALQAQAASLGADPSRIAVAGDSAGAHLAAVAALEAGVALRHQLLLYPVIDSRCTSISHHELAEAPMLSAEMMRWFWRQYLPDAAQAADPRVALLRRADLGRAAPATLITAELDPLREEGEAYAQALVRTGVPVAQRRWPGVFHGFASLLGPLDAAREAIDHGAAQLARAFATS
jgi:acetyl esterase